MRAMIVVVALLCSCDEKKEAAPWPAPVAQPARPPDMADGRTLDEFMEAALMGAGETPEDEFRDMTDNAGQNIGGEVAIAGRITNIDQPSARLAMDGYERGIVWVKMSRTYKIGEHIGVLGTISGIARVEPRAVLAFGDFSRLRSRVQRRIARDKAEDKRREPLPPMPGGHVE